MIASTALLQRRTRRASIGLAVLTCAGLGLSAASAQDEKPKASDQTKKVYQDKDYDFKLIEPKDWKSAPIQSVGVPGKARRVWTPDFKTSVVAFMQEPGQAYTPRVLLDSSAAGMKQLGCEIRIQEVRDVAKMRAMWLVVVGDGTGGALTGQGEVKTLQHWVAVPREKDILVLLLTTPAADYKKHQKAFEQLVESLEIGGKQTAEQKSSK